jgi:hypothetical protein
MVLLSGAHFGPVGSLHPRHRRFLRFVKVDKFSLCCRRLSAVMRRCPSALGSPLGSNLHDLSAEFIGLDTSSADPEGLSTHNRTRGLGQLLCVNAYPHACPFTCHKAACVLAKATSAIDGLQISCRPFRHVRGCVRYLENSRIGEVYRSHAFARHRVGWRSGWRSAATSGRWCIPRVSMVLQGQLRPADEIAHSGIDQRGRGAGCQLPRWRLPGLLGDWDID